MNEGGQSSTGQLIDFIITTHAAYLELKEHPNQEGRNDTTLYPEASSAVNNLPDAKYDIFPVMIYIQKRWRRQIEEASR
ncbi:hypothetical protein P692DRAFT_20869068 [Suillus brevipes Sb2]|nr:hypothetical protein P692DRAFT_20869068 [Suillus brevipes Sb2]